MTLMSMMTLMMVCMPADEIDEDDGMGLGNVGS
jgi:hypothetical protein